ncbi:MAG: amidohydrolase family protein [Oscillospiraceae bacterium]|nr:amidohydrolase family protein [Oscillospiraceae bacterium]
MGTNKPEAQLVVESHHLQTPQFATIDFHTHFGKLFGALVFQKDYFALYDTRETIRKIQGYGIKQVVNLDGCWGDEYLRMREKLKDAGDYVIHFGQVDVERFEERDFEKHVYRTIGELHANGVKGLKFWKNIGLGIRDNAGIYLRPDDERLQCIWQSAAEYHMPVLFHIGDPKAFFYPADERNEYYDTLAQHPEWLFTDPALYSFSQLMEMQENLLEKNPNTKFVIAHVGSYAENLKQVGIWLRRFPNMYVDMADRIHELGRQPYTAKTFFETYADRIVFGTDLLPTDVERYPIYFRFLETYDEYFCSQTENGVKLGNWNIYGIGLSESTLKKVYYDNAASLLGL